MSSSETCSHNLAPRLRRGLATLLFLSTFVLTQATAANAACVGGAPNGAVQGGEQCDDNDSFNNAFCLSNCTYAQCGDSIECTAADCNLSPSLPGGAEECDTGVLRDDTAPDACRTTCEDPDCGDSVVDAGEQCDDGNAVNTGDLCRNDCSIPTCGDGITDPLENCDDANATDTDACQNDCTYPQCGDGVICSDPACTTGFGGGKETCDDGDTDDNDGCSSDCAVEGCGDGIGQGAEQCDAGSSNPPVPVENFGCDADCTVATCGDAYINEAAGEECDDGNVLSNDGCSSGCIDEYCGDGSTNDTDEECDDGGANSDTVPDACRENCKEADCGDSVTDTPENCDDGNNIETDACRNDCTYNVCGDGIVDVTEEGCDDANNDNTDACLSTCIGATCGDGIVQLENIEVCDDGPSSCSGGFDAGEDCATDVDCRGICTSGGNAGQACRVATEVDDCGQPGLCSDAGAVCDDSGNNDQEADACRSTCKAAFCGDGVLDLAENCDSSAPSLNNYCMVSDVGGPPSLVAPYNCAYATCGDGIVCSGTGCNTGPAGGVEQCDDGNNVDTDACRNDCGENICGDGIVETGVEECDDGNANSDTAQDACRTTCKEAHCGDGVLDTPENCDDGNTVNGDMCPNSCVFPSCGDEIVCNDPACTTGFGGGIETCDDGNNNNLDGCDATCRIEGCGDGIGQSPEQCDDAAVGTNPPVAKESATCDLDCTVADCGDGTVNQTRGEECDDGNTNSGDGCDIACQDEFCGDGIDNDGINEECDNGGANSDTVPDACRENCEEAGCGDSVTDTPENCDDGAESADCDDDCTFQSCGDGNLNETAGEECDDDGANAFAPDACRPTCELPRPADGILDPGYGEICDGGPFGNASCNPDGCSTGDAPESYVNGYNGADCEIGGIEGACFDVAIGFDDCSRGSSIEKNFERIKDRLEMSEYREIRGNLGWAERNARQARRRAQRILEKLGDYCPESALVRSCFEVHLGDQDHLVDILVELEANLAANNP